MCFDDSGNGCNALIAGIVVIAGKRKLFPSGIPDLDGNKCSS